MMADVIQLFVGTARIANQSHYAYPTDEKHAILLFLKMDFDPALTSMVSVATAKSYGLKDIGFTRTGRLDPARLKTGMEANYEEALSEGHSLIFYRAPIT